MTVKNIWQIYVFESRHILLKLEQGKCELSGRCERTVEPLFAAKKFSKSLPYTHN